MKAPDAGLVSRRPSPETGKLVYVRSRRAGLAYLNLKEVDLASAYATDERSA